MLQNKGSAPNTPPFPEVQPPVVVVPAMDPSQDDDNDITEIVLLTKDEFESES